jgi:hypothetical protein
MLPRIITVAMSAAMGQVVGNTPYRTTVQNATASGACHAVSRSVSSVATVRRHDRARGAVSGQLLVLAAVEYAGIGKSPFPGVMPSACSRRREGFLCSKCSSPRGGDQ